MLVTSGSSYKSCIVVYVSSRSQTLYIVRLYTAFWWSADNPVFAKHHCRRCTSSNSGVHICGFRKHGCRWLVGYIKVASNFAFVIWMFILEELYTLFTPERELASLIPRSQVNPDKLTNKTVNPPTSRNSYLQRGGGKSDLREICCIKYLQKATPRGRWSVSDCRPELLRRCCQ